MPKRVLRHIDDTEALTAGGVRDHEIDLVEVNEAFASQYCAVERELGLDRERTNVSGGAINLDPYRVELTNGASAGAVYLTVELDYPGHVSGGALLRVPFEGIERVAPDVAAALDVEVDAAQHVDAHARLLEAALEAADGEHLVRLIHSAAPGRDRSAPPSRPGRASRGSSAPAP